jgi:hypothetical protein
MNFVAGEAVAIKPLTFHNYHPKDGRPATFVRYMAGNKVAIVETRHETLRVNVEDLEYW